MLKTCAAFRYLYFRRLDWFKCHMLRKKQRFERPIHQDCSLEHFAALSVITQGPESGTGSWLGVYEDRREGEPTAKTSSRQTARQVTWSLQWQRNAGRGRTDGTHTATITTFPNGASLVRPRNQTHTWVQSSWGPNRMLMLSWCRGVEGSRIPDEL